MKTLLIALLLAGSAAFGATAENLESDLAGLKVDENIPAQSSTEKLYSIQTRHAPLGKHLEILVSAAQNYTSDGFLDTLQAGGDLVYHITDKWNFAVAYSKVFNTFKDSADRLLQTQGLLPDVDYAKSRMEARLGYNLFYGKFRFTSDTVMYFDQYIALGYAQHELASGNSGGPLGDAGFAFWVSNWGSVHIGVKDYYYQEKRALSAGTHHNIHGYLQVGYLL
jgi:outer membrane beta-barrel protein